MDAVEPSAGAGSGVAVAKLLAELHPAASEDVFALVVVGDGYRRRTRVLSYLQSHYLFRDRFGRPGKLPSRWPGR